MKVVAETDICTFMKWRGGVITLRGCLGATYEVAVEDTATTGSQSDMKRCAAQMLARSSALLSMYTTVYRLWQGAPHRWEQGETERRDRGQYASLYLGLSHRTTLNMIYYCRNRHTKSTHLVLLLLLLLLLSVSHHTYHYHQLSHTAHTASSQDCIVYKSTTHERATTKPHHITTTLHTSHLISPHFRVCPVRPVLLSLSVHYFVCCAVLAVHSSCDSPCFAALVFLALLQSVSALCSVFVSRCPIRRHVRGTRCSSSSLLSLPWSLRASPFSSARKWPEAHPPSSQ